MKTTFRATRQVGSHARFEYDPNEPRDDHGRWDSGGGGGGDRESSTLVDSGGGVHHFIPGGATGAVKSALKGHGIKASISRRAPIDMPAIHVENEAHAGAIHDALRAAGGAKLNDLADEIKDHWHLSGRG